MTEKRDESRDVAVWDSIECESHIMRACQWEPGMDARAHHVPFSALESVTRERDAAVRRVVELEYENVSLLSRIQELESLYESEQRQSTALMTHINKLPKEPSDG